MRNPDEDNWKKLRRLLGFLKLTIKLPPILRANGVNALKWRVDALYADHDDMRIHTGGTTSMGKNGCGSIISFRRKKTKQKELEGGRNHWGRRRDAKDAMYKVIAGSKRIWD